MLFAETPDGVVALLITLAGLVGGAGVWLAAYLAGRRKENRDNLKEDEATIVGHQEKLIARLSRELDEMRAKVEAQNKLTSRLIAHMSYLEGIMSAKGIKFRRFAEEPGDAGTFETADAEERE